MTLRETHIRVSRRDDGELDAEFTPTPAPDDEGDLRDRMAQRDNPELEAFLRGERDTAEGTVAFAAGGSIPAISTADGLYIPVGRRDGGAPSYAHHLASASGLADTTADVLQPHRIAAREGVEEILYATDSVDGGSPEWLVPVPGEYADIARDATESLTNLWNATADGLDHVIADPVINLPGGMARREVPAELQPFGDDTATVHVDGDSVTSHGQLVIDTEENIVDMMALLTIDLSEWSLADLRLFDGEVVGGDTLLNREVYLFEPSELAALGDGAETVTAHRHYQGGLVWDDDDGMFVEEYAQGTPVTLDSPDVVPNLAATAKLAADSVQED